MGKNQYTFRGLNEPAGTSKTPEPLREPAPAYEPPQPDKSIDLFLSDNEGAPPPLTLFDRLAAVEPEIVRRYPSARALEQTISRRLGYDPERIFVAAGADECMDRMCRLFLGPGRRAVLPIPTFEMLPRFAALAGAEIDTVDWPPGPYPAGAVIGAIRPETALVAIVSPNNPTGAVANKNDLEAIAESAPHAVILVDHAYVEFADADLTDAALNLPNAVVLRTFSKAYGLAGIRVGYAAGPAGLIKKLRSCGGPYTVSGPSVALAALRLKHDGDVAPFIQRVRWERDDLFRRLEELGARPYPSQGNFVLARFPEVSRVQDALAGFGIAVRSFPEDQSLNGALRMTCPGNDTDYERLVNALETILTHKTGVNRVSKKIKNDKEVLS